MAMDRIREDLIIHLSGISNCLGKLHSYRFIPEGTYLSEKFPISFKTSQNLNGSTGWRQHGLNLAGNLREVTQRKAYKNDRQHSY